MAEPMQGIMSLPEGSPPEQTEQVNPALFSPVVQSYARTKPVEFGNDIMSSLSEADPGMMANFLQEISSLKLTPEEIDTLGQLIDYIVANPEQYAEIRDRLIREDGMPEDFLPEEFDPGFFTMFGIALDQLSNMQAPEMPMAMARGGIATLTPMALEISNMGRKGDTMLAHITPSEARMLRRRGGSGTINPKTGLPEFFIGDLLGGIVDFAKRTIRGVGKAIKNVAQSTVGRIILTAAAVWVMGPTALNFAGTLGLKGATALGVNTFAASTAVSLASGSSFKDALRNGAISGLTAGVAGKAFGLPASYQTGAAAAAPASNAIATATVQQADDVIAQADDFIGQQAMKAGTPSPDKITASMGEPGIREITSPAGAMDKARAISGGLSNPDFYAQQLAKQGFNVPGGTTAQVAPAAASSVAPPGSPTPAVTPPSVTPPAAPPTTYFQGVKPPVTPPVQPSVAPPVAPPVVSTMPTSPNVPMPAQTNLLDQGVGTGLRGPGIPRTTVADVGLPTQFQNAQAGGIGSISRTAAEPGIMNSLTSGNYMDAAKQAYNYISPTEIQRQGAKDAIRAVQEQFKNLNVTEQQIINAPPGSVLNTAYQNALPGMMATYGPMIAAGTLGAAALGAFDKPDNPKPPGFSGPTGAELLRQQPQTYGLRFGGVNTTYAPNPYDYMYQLPISRAQGGIAALPAYAKGGPYRHFPRKTGPINGPGTGTSDSIPAMLSDGEFVFTAKAVRAAGKGSRRAGAKRMYALMKALEKKA